MSRPTRNGTPQPVSRDQILRRERGHKNMYFPCSADHEQDWQPYPVDPYSCYMCDYTLLVITKLHNALTHVLERTGWLSFASPRSWRRECPSGGGCTWNPLLRCWRQGKGSSSVCRFSSIASQHACVPSLSFYVNPYNISWKQKTPLCLTSTRASRFECVCCILSSQGVFAAAK